MFLRFTYYKDFFLGHRFGLKYYNSTYLNFRFRIFFFLMESFFQSGCNLFFIGGDSRLGVKFFKDLSKFYFFTSRTFFYRGILNNDSVYCFDYKYLPTFSSNLKSHFLLEGGANWDNYFLFLSNYNLISNSKKNIFLIFGNSEALEDYDLILKKNNILIFVGLAGLDLYYSGYRLFLDFNNEGSFKYLQFLIFFILNIFSLNSINFTKISSFYNVYSLLKWKKYGWYSSTYFFERYRYFSFLDLNNFLKSDFSKFSNIYGTFLNKSRSVKNYSVCNLSRCVTNFYSGFNSDSFFRLKISKLKNFYFFYWTAFSNFWFFSYYYKLYDLSNYRSFFIKVSLPTLLNSFFFEFSNLLTTELNQNICFWQRSLTNNYLQNVYYFKNLKILDLNFVYNKYAFCRFSYEQFFFKRFLGGSFFLRDNFSIFNISSLSWRINKIHFYLTNFRLNFLSDSKKNFIKRLMHLFNVKFLLFFVKLEWLVVDPVMSKNYSLVWNFSHFFFIWQSKFKSFKFQVVILKFLNFFFFKCGNLVSYGSGFKKLILYYFSLREKIGEITFFCSSSSKLKTFFYIRNNLHFFKYFNFFSEFINLRKLNFIKTLRLKFYLYRSVFFYSFYAIQFFFLRYRFSKPLWRLGRGYFFFFLFKNVIFLKNLRWNLTFLFFFFSKLFKFLD